MKPKLSRQASRSAHCNVVRHKMAVPAIAVALACAGTAVSNEARSQTCNEVMDRAAADMLAQPDLIQL